MNSIANETVDDVSIPTAVRRWDDNESTTCCNAAVSISTDYGFTYCKMCYRPVEEVLDEQGNHIFYMDC